MCGLAVQLCGSQERFRKEANILRRLVQRFGATEVERMILGAQQLQWDSLRSLGSKDGLGRRWALEAHWQRMKRVPMDTLESVAQTLKARGF